MKVLMINSVCGIRSTGRICTDLADVLTAQGHQVKIAYGRETVPEIYQKYAVPIGHDLDVKAHALEARLFDNAGFGSKRATRRFITWLKAYDPDVIHLHNIHGYYINIEELFSYLKTCGKKIVWTLHDCWTFTGHCAHFDFVGCEKWKTQCGHCPQLKEYPASLWADHSERNYRMKKELFTGISHMTLVTPSRWLSQLLKESFLAEYPVKVINNGIDTSVFKPRDGDFQNQSSLKNKKIILGVASVWSLRKGIDDFIKLSQRLDDSYRIVLVGLSDAQINTLPKNIIGISRTNDVRELAEIYTAADVFFNPTYEDSYPTVNLEAQACGTPVVTYETGGSPESINTDYGFIVPKGDLDAALEKILECVRKGKSDEYIGSADFSKAAACKQYINLYGFSSDEI